MSEADAVDLDVRDGAAVSTAPRPDVLRWTLTILALILGALSGAVLGAMVGLLTGLIPFAC